MQNLKISTKSNQNEINLTPQEYTNITKTPE